MSNLGAFVGFHRFIMSHGMVSLIMLFCGMFVSFCSRLVMFGGLHMFIFGH